MVGLHDIIQDSFIMSPLRVPGSRIMSAAPRQYFYRTILLGWRCDVALTFDSGFSTRNQDRIKSCDMCSQDLQATQSLFFHGDVLYILDTQI